MAPCPACGTSVTSVEAPAIVTVGGRSGIVWLEVFCCRCGRTFLPADADRLLREAGRDEIPWDEHDPPEGA